MYPFFSEWTTFQCDRIFRKFLPSIRTAIRKFFAKDLSLFKLDSIFTFRYLLWSLYQLDWNAFYLRGHLQFPSSYRLSHLTYAHTRTHLRTHTHTHLHPHALFFSLCICKHNRLIYPYSQVLDLFFHSSSVELLLLNVQSFLCLCVCVCVMASLSLSGDVCACVFVDL